MLRMLCQWPINVTSNTAGRAVETTGRKNNILAPRRRGSELQTACLTVRSRLTTQSLGRTKMFVNRMYNAYKIQQ